MPAKRRKHSTIFDEINWYPTILLLLFFAFFSLAVLSQSMIVFNFGKYLLIPISFVGMIFRIAMFTPANINIVKSPILLILSLTCYVFFAEFPLMYGLWLGGFWSLFAVIPLGLLFYSIYMKFNRESSAYYSGWNILLILLIPVLIFISIFPCGFVPEWIPWTPFWLNVTTGPCL